MGLFENPYPASVADQTWSSLIHTSDAVQLAYNLDRESIILLENHNNILPLKKSGSIAVIGPMAHGFVNVSQLTWFYRYYSYSRPLCVNCIEYSSTATTSSKGAWPEALPLWTELKLLLAIQRQLITQWVASAGAMISPAFKKPSTQLKNRTLQSSLLVHGPGIKMNSGRDSMRRTFLSL